MRTRYTSAESLEPLVEDLVRTKLLVEEARRRRLDQDPEFLATVDRLLIQRLLQAQPGLPAVASEEELQKFYEQHRAEFDRPERLRISQIFLAASKGSADRSKIESEAKRLLEELRKKQSGGDGGAFAVAARSRSDDPASRPLSGDLGFRTADELASAIGPPAKEAAAKLVFPGDIALVATDRGLHLIRLTARQAGIHLDFEAAKPRIESRLAAERRTGSAEELVDKLRRQTKVEIDQRALAKLAAEVAAGGLTDGGR